MRDARKEQRGFNEAEAYISVVNAGAEFWKKVRKWAADSIDVKPSDLILLDLASAMPRRLPNEKQALRLVELQHMFVDEVS
jgi:hypothetical protein